MTSFQILDLVANEIEVARKLIAKAKGTQIRSADDIDAIKACVAAWFHNHRRDILLLTAGLDLSAVDSAYHEVLSLTTKAATKTSYIKELKFTKAAIHAARNESLVVDTSESKTAASEDLATEDLAPDFSPLAGSVEMRDILSRRWNECRKCVNAEAHLAAIVMMGGMLEALFVARANRMSDKSGLINAMAAPRDKATGKTLNYQEWMLDSYIKVGRELNWITESARNFADTLKEYRNYVHPEKERRHGVVLDFNDSSLLWQVTKALSRQLLVSAMTGK